MVQTSGNYIPLENVPHIPHHSFRPDLDETEKSSDSKSDQYFLAVSTTSIENEIQEAHTSNPRLKHRLGQKSKFTGWRVGVIYVCLLTIVSLIVNIVAERLIAQREEIADWQTTLFKGDCGTASRFNTLLHVAINILSTALLAGSNYCMQCLIAPTRSVINRWHRRGKWLDVGVPSLRNLAAVPITNRVCWVLLLLSSLPLHLVYNSAFFLSVATNDYQIVVAMPDFLDGIVPPPTGKDEIDVPLEYVQSHIDEMERLDNAHCIRSYAVDLVADRSNVLIVTTNTSVSVPLPPMPYVNSYKNYDIHPASMKYRPFEWLCNDTQSREKYGFAIDDNPQDLLGQCYQHIDLVAAKPDIWSPFGFQPDYCLSQPVQRKCVFYAFHPYLVVVIICNAVKVAVMLYTVLCLKGDPILTIGDAVESFLANPDDTTNGLCLLSYENVRSATSSSLATRGLFPAIKRQNLVSVQQLFTKKHPRRYEVVSRSHWAIILGLGLIYMVLAIVFLSIALDSPRLKATKSLSYLYKFGFGAVHAQTLIGGPGWIVDQFSDNYKLTRTVVIANSPQLLFSFIYFNLNYLHTSMSLATEWARYGQGVVRRTLRTSRPQGKQRSTYFLSLPYRFALGFMFVQTVIHWLASQSLFLVSIDLWSWSGTFEPQFSMTCGYSPMAIIALIFVFLLLLILTVIMGQKKLRSNIPLVGSCSIAISAACHASPDEEDVGLKPLTWGVIAGMTDAAGRQHCGFSSSEVCQPEEGKEYW